MAGERAVLFVDDEASNRTAVAYALGDDLAIDTAASAAEALERLASQRYAVLLTDQRMPGMTGIELCRRAAQLHPTTVRMILTAYADIEGAIRAVEEGQVVRYLRKPFDNDELLQTLRAGVELHLAQRRVEELQTQLSAVQPEQIAKIARQEVLHDVANVSLSISAGLDWMQTALEHADPAQQLEGVRKAFGNLLQSGDRLQELTRSMKTEPLASDRSRPSVAIGEVVRSFALLVPPTIRLRSRIDADPTIAMHEGALFRVVSNLTLNALQAVERRGRGHVELRLREDEERVVFEVHDDGPGVPPELAERIFERGFSTRADGNGLGLPMVRELLGAVGAEIGVCPVAPGTCFQVVWRRVSG